MYSGWNLPTQPSTSKVTVCENKNSKAHNDFNELKEVVRRGSKTVTSFSPTGCPTDQKAAVPAIEAAVSTSTRTAEGAT